MANPTYLENYIEGVQQGRAARTKYPFIAAAKTATTAGGATAPGLAFGLGANGVLGFYWGSGAPTITAPQGSVYLNTTGSSTSTRLYVNTTGSTTWTAVTTAA